MAPKYKLTYFNIKGRAELARMLFALAEVEYEDVRITREQLMELKPKLPNGQLPVLEVDGKVFSQSNAIARYLANEFGLAGKSPLEKLKADMARDTMGDLAQPLMAIFSAKDDDEKAAIRKKYAEEQAPLMLSNLEKMVEDTGFFSGASITYADVNLVCFLDFPKMVGINLDLSKYPKLQGVVEKVQSNPKIAAWIAKRPDTV